MEFHVEMRTRADGAEGLVKTHVGAVEAESCLNAVGKACLRFGVRTDRIIYLHVEARDAGVDEASP